MQAGAHFRLAHSCRNAQDATLREALHSRTHAPVSVPTAANALPVRTATALPPLLPPGDLRPARLVRDDANIDARRHAGVWTPLTWLVSSHQRADGRPVGTEHVEGPHAELVLRFAQQMIAACTGGCGACLRTMLVFPTITAPAALNRAVTVDCRERQVSHLRTGAGTACAPQWLERGGAASWTRQSSGRPACRSCPEKSWRHCQ